jgi:putative Mg2+ transporter-C (MgtC) family protein
MMDLVWSDIFKLLLTAFLAILIGYDREKRNKAAGVRTNLIVAVISCLLMIISIKIAGSDLGLANDADPARLAAQVISGIGFLGAGTIIKQEDKIEGLTTAASLWGVAGIGLAVGYGLYGLAITAVVIIFGALLVG